MPTPRTALRTATALPIVGSACLFFVALTTAHAQTQSTYTLGLYSTGESSVYSASTQTQFSAGSADTAWTILTSPGAIGSSTALVTTPNTAWTPDTTTSKWISNVANSTSSTASAAGNYDYQTSFIIPTNVELSTVQITFKVAEDDTLSSVLLNGSATGITYSSFTTISGTETINASNATFKTGTNTIDFVVNNQGTTPNPTGLDVLFTSGTGTQSMPEPASAGLLMLGITGFLGKRSRGKTS